jgi:hypothetical protein
MKGLARHQRFHRRRCAARAQIEIESRFPHRHQKDGVPRLAHILLRDLQLDGLVGFFQRGEKRRRGFAHLKIDRPVLDLNHHVGIELAIQVVEVVIGRAGAVVLRVAPVHVMVVDEAAVEEQAAVRRQRARHHVGGVGVGAVVVRRAGAALRIGLHHKTGEIRDGPIQFIDFLFPPGGDAGVERIEGIQAAENLGARKIDR